MNEEYVSFLENIHKVQSNNLIEKLKLLVYKESKELFHLLDFENDVIWKEPLLYAYFNNSNTNYGNLIWQILYGYIEDINKPKNIEFNADKYGNIYLPNLGWIINLKPNVKYNITFNSGHYFNNNDLIKFTNLEILTNYPLEILIYPIEILDCRFYNYKLELENVEILTINESKKDYLNNVVEFIKNDLLGKFILKSCFKILLFNDYTNEFAKSCTVNSFATLNAQGIIFLNVYQPGYNEVYYLDEIAYQSSRLLFNVLTYNSSDFYKLDPKSIIECNSEYGKKIDVIEPRSYEMIFQAMFSYSNTLKLMDKYFDSSTKIEYKHELLGRIAYYLAKLKRELELFEPFNSNIFNSKIYTPNGIFIINEIKHSWIEILDKYQDRVSEFDFSNQSYKFNYKLFLQNNER